MANHALIVGATGITGSNIAHELVAKGWKVTGLSRKPGIEVPGISHVYADVLDAAGLTDAISDLGVTHLFFCTWSRQATEAENCEVNGAMMRNTLAAVNAKTPIQHAVLITGLKHYLGPFEDYAKNPAETPFRESQGRLPGLNFYYVQEDELFASAAKHGHTWSVHRPHTMIGYALGNVMNMGVTLALYASICKHTGRPWVFPGSVEQYNGVTDVTDARILAKHAVWSATEPAAANEAFNTVNGDVFRWRQLWTAIGEYFGLENPGHPGEVQPLEPRMSDADEVWADIVAAHGLAEFKATDLASWWHTDADLGRTVETFADMGKSRELGFKEFQVTIKSFTDLFDRLRAERIIP
ncbi:MAG: SDR family oxidoreductase [Agromyces sp.]